MSSYRAFEGAAKHETHCDRKYIKLIKETEQIMFNNNEQKLSKSRIINFIMCNGWITWLTARYVSLKYFIISYTLKDWWCGCV